MTGRGPENLTQEPLEEKRGKLQGFDELDVSEKKAFDSLVLPKKGKGEKYTNKDIREGIINTIQNGINHADLQSPEKENAEKIQKDISKNLQGNDPILFIKSYAKFRTELISYISVDSGKDQKPTLDFIEAKRTASNTEEYKNDFFEECARKLGEILLLGTEKRRKAEINARQEAQGKGNTEAQESQRDARETLSNWLKLPTL